MTIQVTLPALGESVVEGTIGKWLVHVGQRIEKDQPLVEILTDKADSEIPAPTAGVVTQLMASANDTVAVGGVLCEIDESAQAAASQGAAEPAAKAVPAAANSAAPAQDRKPASGNGPAIHASPAVRKLAREQDVTLESLQGTGEGGRITRDDVLRNRAQGDQAVPPPTPIAPTAPRAALPNANPSPAAPTHDLGAVTPTAFGAFKPPPYQPRPGDEVVPFSRRRRIIADHMIYSKRVAPDVVTLAECDMHRSHLLRESQKNELKREGINLSFLAFTAAAVCRALREHPDLNARVLDDAYVKLRDIHLGIAVDTPQGLVVPVLRNADQLTVRGLARGIDDLAARARDNKLSPDDLAAKTFTISNPGRSGNLVGGAIISQPNVAILRLGTIKKRVVVVEHAGEDLLAIHPVMHMALTYDHRVIDGVLANTFLHRIVELLELGEFEI